MVDLQLANGMTARAQFNPGKPGKPALLILHGFLQTFESPTVHHLVEELHDQGYPVLSPNLSLNVTNRRQSLACEAIHTHTMAGDLAEIDAWVNWLMRTRPAGIILVGHSFGSVHGLAYLHARPNAPVKKFIGISVVEARVNLSDAEIGSLRQDLRKRVLRDNKEILTRPFSYCSKFTATPASLLSYLDWAPEKILDAARKLPVSGTFIMGSHDERLGPRWIERLQDTPAKVVVISGANHFMDGEFEFNLFDTLSAELQSASHQ
jgi:pimeloyl-ACP methyl ester carboxylesterase